jgi:GR25 family glycosyltransferase involved in LPS biosynthesis
MIARYIVLSILLCVVLVVIIVSFYVHCHSGNVGAYKGTNSGPDIYSMPLYYISFKKNNNLEDHLRSHGFTNINHFKAVDGRKMDVDKLINDRIISVRSYTDLMIGRQEHSGMPGKGGVGCAISHSETWKICVENNYPYMIITEDDVNMYDIDEQKMAKIHETLSKPKSIFVGTDKRFKKRPITDFIGLQSQ